MHTYCDRCNEVADHTVDAASDPQLTELLKDLGYRTVCPGCYEDLVVEAREAREQQAEDRRSVHRVPAHIPLRLTSTDGGSFTETVTEDISESGAQIRANSELEPGTVVHIAALDGSADAVAIVEVVWHDDDALRAGLRLVESSETWSRLVLAHEARKL